MTLLVFRAVDWYVTAKDNWDMPGYRTCDICHYCPTDDMYKGGKWMELRDWVLLPDGCSVCSHCIEGVLLEPED